MSIEPATAFLDEMVSTGNVSEDLITISPNPTSGLVTLKINSTQISSCELITVTGDILQKIDPDTHLMLDLTPLPSGFYFLRVVSNNQSKLYKIVRL